nr:hypothetical protein [Candidatus Contendobacter sp.]
AAFADLGADLLFLEAPRDEAEMARGCREVPGVHLANMLVGGLTPILPPARLAELGYRLAAYPLALLAVAVAAMQEALRELAAGRMPERQMDFAALRTLVGFAPPFGDSATDPRLDTGGWLALARRGLAPRKKCRALLGAITLKLSCLRRRVQARTATIVRLAQAGLTAPAVAGQLEREVRLRCAPHFS